VTSSYEAAAEMLIEHSLAIVIDLRCLTSGDLPLVEMARQRDLEILAVGSAPLGVSNCDLSGVRLSSRESLAGLLTTLAACRDQTIEEAQPPCEPVAVSEPVSATGQWVKRRPLSEPRDVELPASQNEPEPEPEIAEPAHHVRNVQEGYRPSALLTSEEIEALLEDGV
jgi:hypothetical protein